MDEIRAALAIARKHVVTMSRYRVAMVSMVFIPLYQGVIPAFLFGAALIAVLLAANEQWCGELDLSGVRRRR